MPSNIAGNSFLPGDACCRNLVIGPAYVNLDSSLAKDFKIAEKYTLDVRAEAFNTSGILSTLRARLDSSFSSGTFGQINRVLGSTNREAQLAAKIIF